LTGEYVRKSLNLDAWEAATDLVRAWESSGRIGVVRPEIPSLREAVAKYIEDADARPRAGDGQETAGCRGTPVPRLLLTSRLRIVAAPCVSDIRDNRHFLAKRYAGTSTQSRLEYVRGFLRFCQQSGWIATNPALAVNAPRTTADRDPSTQRGFSRVRAQLFDIDI
jgi:hypothetical protein